ncbi:transmembrane protein 238-like [Malaclemys terrapin pileata]|uniref:transmembrane protein 238-like n=1 Tax=Malaclemys terrapin pileata TaxID=2991368 RepID=UPI0023A7E2B1|nr:transmembrane protein 238-like [Malaclemys terrapin pileata]
MAWGCGRCALFLLGALALDAAGLALVLVGSVVQPARAGRPYGDCLVLSGALLLFLSLLCWLLWYTGNLRGVPASELPPGARSPPPGPRSSLLRLASKLSERLSQRRPPLPCPSLPAPGSLELPCLCAMESPVAHGDRLV